MSPHPLALILSLSLLATHALAQVQTLERIEVIGSRMPRLDAETALPVQIIRRDEIERSGVSNAEELLDLVSANFGGHREALGLGDGDTPGLSGASLRGFGASETLVLLNGRRLANYAFSGTGGPGVDLHAIPLAAIDRVEVLKDGASALYGSDAIAGVINFVTRQDYAGAGITLNYSGSEAGGGERKRATLAFGSGDIAADGFNLFGVLDVQRAERLRATDRSFAETSYRPELGLDGTRPQSFPANIRRVVNGTPTLLNPAAPACTTLTVNKDRACWFDYAKTLDLLPPSRQTTLLGRGTLRLTQDSAAYAELLAATSRIVFTASPSPASASASQGGVRFILPASSPYYPTALGLSGGLVLAYRTLPLGGRTTEVNSDNVRLLTGIKSHLAGWDLDSALNINDSRSRERYVSGFVDAGRLADAIGSGLVNPFGPSGAQGDALLAGAELRGPSREARGRTQGADLRASRDLVTLPGGPLGLAIGIEGRHEGLRDSQSALVADVIGGVPAAPKDGARNALAFYGEMVTPLIKGLEVQAAARVDHYNDFGTAVSPKIALRLQPARWLLLRGSIGRGFRAPSLPELYTQQASGFFELANVGVSDPARCPVTKLPSDCQPEVFLVSGGNPNLRPQRSTQSSVGFVLEAGPAWQLSADHWKIRVRDIIGVVDAFDVIDNIPLYEGRNVIRGPVDPAFPGLPGPIVRIETLNENLGDWRVEGTDLSIRLRPTTTPLGRVSLRLDGTYVQRARQNIFLGNEVNLIGRRAPRWQHVLTMNLERGAWSATLLQRYRRGYADAEPLPDGSTHRVAAYRLWDGQFAFAVSRDVRVTLGVRNLFDTNPPSTNQANTFQVGYDPLYANPLGRTWTVGLVAAWR